MAAEGGCDGAEPKRARLDESAEPLSEAVTLRSGVRMPRMIYGTAWKEEQTQNLVQRAVKAGFRGIDTACQPKHYREAAVGAALSTLFGDGSLRREDLFVQTKVNRNYAAELAPGLPIEQQAAACIEKSLSNLGLPFVDSLLLHSPYSQHEDTMRAWRAMEAAVEAGKARQLGLSNLKSTRQLEEIYKEAIVKPAVVQQRFYSETGFEVKMRAWCKEHDVHFQSFWTLTANSKRGRRGRDFVLCPLMRDLAEKYKVTPQVLFFRLVMGMNIIPLNGTCDDEHMAQDLQARQVPLQTEDFQSLQDALLRVPDASSSSS